METPSTSERILDAALHSFAGKGYEATSLDHLAAGLGIRKQTILYWFPTKDAILAAVVERTAAELAVALEAPFARSREGWGRVDGVVRAVFRLALRRPEVLGLVREVSRLGPPATTSLVGALDPLVQRATVFLEREMAAGRIRQQDARMVLMTAYSSVIGVATEANVLQALGVEPTVGSLLRRRNELLGFLRSALAP